MTLSFVFISSKDTDEERDMYVENENIIFISVSNISYLAKSTFNSILSEHSNNLFKHLTVSDFIFDYVDQAYYSCDKTNLKRGESNIKTPKWLKSTKATINDTHREKLLLY